MKIRFPKRISLRVALALIAVVAVMTGLSVRWHKTSMQNFTALQRLDADSPNPMIYFEQMLTRDQQSGLYKFKEGDCLKLPPDGMNAFLCRFFHRHYVCRPRAIVYVDSPPEKSIDSVRDLPTIELILFVTDTRTAKKWAQEFPDRKVLSWKDYRTLTSEKPIE